MASRKAIPYLSKRSDTDGYFFLRRVPLDVREAVGKTQWRWKLADTLAEARRCLPEAIANTDQLIADLRAGKTVSTRPQQQPRQLAKDLLAGKPAAEVFSSDYFHGTPEEAIELSQMPPVQLAGHKQFTAQDVLDLNTRLKNTASPQTIGGWNKTMKEFTSFIGHDQLHQLTKEDCQRYRDHLLDTVAVSTLKTRMGRIAALLELALEEGHLTFNPASGLTKRLATPQTPPKELDTSSDDKVSRMAQHHQDLYWLIRWTGMRVAEAAGIHLTDIDLNKQLIYVRPHPDRPLKNKYSERELPIHLKLLPVLERLVTAGVRPFLMYYKPQRNRWEAGNNWRKVVNANPHLLRHHASTCMRNAGFQEYVIGKTLGHEVKGITAQYGTVSPEKIKAAVYSIV